MLRLVAQQTKLVPIFWARDDPEAAQWLRSGANKPPFASCLTSGSTRNPTHPVPNITKGKKYQRPVTITLPFLRDAQAHAWRGSRKPAMALSESNAKIKGNVIHLWVLPRAEHSRKIFHKDLKILGSPCFWPKAAQWFVVTQHCAICLLESRSPKGLSKSLAKHTLSSLFFFVFLTFPKSWILKEQKAFFSSERTSMAFVCQFPFLSPVHQCMSQRWGRKLCSLGLGFEADPLKSDKAWWTRTAPHTEELPPWVQPNSNSSYSKNAWVPCANVH